MRLIVMMNNCGYHLYILKVAWRWRFDSDCKMVLA
jgi:hypothetical protein